MSVIPFIINGPSRTVVESRSDFDQAGGLDGNVLLIQGFDRNQFSSAESGNASYDLRIGREYRDHRDAGKRELANDGVIKLLPGAAIIIETEESVHFPKSAFGCIVPKVSLLQKGISNTPSKVDPGYSGNLLITVFNLGKKTVELRRGEAFGSLCIFEVGKGVQPYDKPQKRIEGEAKSKKWQRARDFLETNSALINICLIIATIILISIQIMQFLAKK